MQYNDFLKAKRRTVVPSGFDIEPEQINSNMFLFQRDIVRWAAHLGKAAIFADTGLGKTLMQLEIMRHVSERQNSPVLILAPLAVAPQTIEEGIKFGIDATHARSGSDIDGPGIYVTNYEMLHKFDVSVFAGVALDESSILKNFTGTTKRRLVEAFKHTPYKFAFSATPAPNDHLELGNHAEFLDIMPSNEMIARWFINNTNKANDYRLKKHAAQDFWRWLTSWAVCISRPGDLGAQYDMPDYELPELRIYEHALSAPQASIDRAHANGMLLPDTNPSSTTLHKVKRESLSDRIERVQEIVSAIDDTEPVIIWCDTNYEADALVEVFPNALEVRGAETANAKEEKLMAFSHGQARMIITKPDIAGFGLNWQHCHEVVYAGVGFSFEKLYQSLKRTHRYGQQHAVNAHLIYAETEGSVKTALDEKRRQFEEMQKNMNAAMRKYGLFRDGSRLELTTPEEDVAVGRDWTLYLGDCVPTTAHRIADDSLHFSVYSPPFAQLYIYSDSEADMGNSSTMEEFLEHYGYLVKDLYRATMPGRLTAVHVKDLPLYKSSSEWFGIEDFSGMVANLHRQHGWIFHSRITIWKDPVNEMEKTNSHGLLHKNFATRAQVVRTGLPDYLMVFVKPDPDAMGEDVKQLRKPGDYIGANAPNPAEYLNSLRQRTPEYYPGSVDEYNYSIAVWQRYASPVWFDIRQTEVLNYQQSKSGEDEKHICPLQLDVIARAIDLWTNRGDVVFSPFTGIGSEGHEAIKLGRKFIGVELKRNYWQSAIRHLENAERIANMPTLFDWAEEQAGNEPA